MLVHDNRLVKCSLRVYFRFGMVCVCVMCMVRQFTYPSSDSRLRTINVEYDSNSIVSRTHAYTSNNTLSRSLSLSICICSIEGEHLWHTRQALLNVTPHTPNIQIHDVYLTQRVALCV